MGWSIGYDSNWQRDIGYGVPAFCDHPGCNAEIDRGLSYVCGGGPYGENDTRSGCGLFFCAKHLWMTIHGQMCNRCANYKPPYKRIKPEHPQWALFKLLDASWEKWRAEPRNKREIATLRKLAEGLSARDRKEVLEEVDDYGKELNGNL